MKPDLKLSLTISTSLALQIATYPGVFFANPFSDPSMTVVGVSQVFSLVGWIVLLFAPPVIVVFRARLGRSFSLYLTIAALMWSTVRVLDQCVFIAFNGVPESIYLITYPIFAFSDIVAPIVYLQIARHAKSLYRLALRNQQQLG